MDTSVQLRPRAAGLAGSIIGLLALIAAVLPQWALPAVLPAPPGERIVIDTGHSLRERVIAKLKGVSGKRQKPRSELEIWSQRFSAAAIALALLAITLAVISLIRREEKLYAGLAAAPGIGAIAFQLTLLYAGPIFAIILLYAVRNQLDETLPFGAIAIGLVAILSIIGLVAAGLASPAVLALVIGAAIAIPVIYFIIGGF
jgi:hypothetical protein